MGKINIGDVYEIETKKGKAYFQYCYMDNSKIEQIKVFNEIYKERPSELDEIIKNKASYFIGFPLGAAYRKKIVEFVGNKALPESFVRPIIRRSVHKIRGEFLGWFIINSETLQRELVKELNDDQKKLSPDGVCNDTFLIERLENGWSLENWSV
jgi:hypothetical protein